MKRKLKGKLVEKISEKKKAKMKATLAKMDKTRENDNKLLRESLEEKLKWAQEEVKKGQQVIDIQEKIIEESRNKINTIKISLLRLDGAITAIKQLLNEEEKKEE